MTLPPGQHEIGEFPRFGLRQFIGRFLAETRRVSLKVSGRALAAAALVVVGGVQPAAGGPLAPQLKRVVESLAIQFSDGIASFGGGEAERGKQGTYFEDKVVVIFALESWGGGNGSRQFLAVFERQQDSFAVLEGRFRLSRPERFQ